MSTSGWSKNNEFGKNGYFVAKKTIHEMGLKFHGANWTCMKAHWEQIHTSYDRLCNKVGGGKSTMNEHSCNHNHVHL